MRTGLPLMNGRRAVQAALLGVAALVLACSGSEEVGPAGDGSLPDAAGQDAPADAPGDQRDAGADAGGQPCQGPDDCRTAFADLGPCEQAICDLEAGRCLRVTLPSGSPCQGDLCLTGQTCLAGQCQGGSAIDCDDANDCTHDTCEPTTGLCGHAALKDTPCDDGDPCTETDVCDDGVCVPGAPFACDDANPCTIDACDPQTGGCLWTVHAGPCDDGEPCTVGDACVAGVCTAGAPLECADDGDRCNGVPRCVDGACDLPPDSVVVCDPGGDTPCLRNTCQPATGTCLLQPEPNGARCDDDDFCTADTFCLAGACQGGTPLACDDGNPCTDDVCDPAAGCASEANAAPCYDGNPCTVDDTCAAGACVGGENTCPCASDAQCAIHEDGDRCNGWLVCVGDRCVVPPESIVVCATEAEGPCEAMQCQPATGECVTLPLPDGTPCATADACAAGAVCAAGACVAAAPRLCDDHNPCTDDRCDPVLGCVFASRDGALCEDGNPCTLGDVCDNGRCAPGNNTCACTSDDACGVHDDANRCNGRLHCVAALCVVDPETIVQCDASGDTACAESRCNPENGLCTIVFAADGQACDDDDRCTDADACLAGQCRGEAGLPCDDGNPCTGDTCEPALGCRFAPEAGACDDGDACTVGDACAGGTCVPGVFACACDSDVDCPDDGDLCNGVYRCVDGLCITPPDSLVRCDATNDTPCLVNACRRETGACEMQPQSDGTPCADGDRCSSDDACLAGVCIGGDTVSCDDDNACTTDRCDADLGCVFEPHTEPCDDGDPCTSGDACLAGQCLGGPPTDCDDGNACTHDACVAREGCEWVPIAGPCDDGDFCTAGDFCAAGTCEPGPDSPCDDDNGCTTDACSAASGCSNEPNSEPCDDANRCTENDRCVAGGCLGGAAPACDDRNDCTADGCLAAVGCTHTPLGGADCDDANPCTNGELCSETGSCGGGSAVVCDDGNVCTDDRCVPGAGGCVYDPNTSVCSDGDPCTSGDACALGVCQPGPTLVCDPCQSTADCAPYEDGDRCNGILVCRERRCVVDATTVVICDPAADTACSRNTCVPASGLCAQAPVTGGTLCDDASLCTTGDHCEAGVCVGTTTRCIDDNPCTDDRCDPALGCVFAANVAACNDGNACTGDDRCAGGQCRGAPVDCNDQNLCTTDSCDPESGCVNAQNTLLCDDGDVCTLDDRCADGVCASGSELRCDDANDCTDDRCDPRLGCQHAPNADPCDDRNPCTVDDRCTAATCAGSARDCDDGVACTQDSCNGLTGTCVHAAQATWCDDDNLCTLDTCAAAGCAHVDQCCAGIPEVQCGDTVVGDTRGAPTRLSAYSCSPWAETGPELFYRFAPPENTVVTATLTPAVGVDLDVFILEAPDAGACDPAGCVAFGDVTAAALANVAAGHAYYVAVEGYDGAAGPYTLTLSCALIELCSNGSDDDGDGFADCLDPDCSDDPACPEACANGVDDDADALVDCADPECTFAPECAVACAGEPTDLVCGAELLVDTAGSATSDVLDAYDCLPDLAMTGPEAVFRYTAGADTTVLFRERGAGVAGLHVFALGEPCDNAHCLGGAEVGLLVPLAAGETVYFAVDGLDGLSGVTEVLFACAEPEVCDDGADNDLDTLADCLDVDCDGSAGCEFGGELSCADGFDNDGDGAADCADADCAADPACAAPYEIDCTNGADDDLDTDIDCADDDCRVSAACGVCAEDDLEDYDDLPTAYPHGDASDVYADRAVLAADEDWFEIALCAGATVEAYAHFYQVDGDIDLGLYDASGVLLTYSTSVDDDEYLSYTASTARNVYLRAMLWDGDCTRYDLWLFVDSSACAGPAEICTGGTDEDDDGLTDCADPDCDADPACPEACVTLDSIGCGAVVSGSTVGLDNAISSYVCTSWTETGPEAFFAFTVAADTEVLAAVTSTTADLDLFVLEGDCLDSACIEAGDTDLVFNAVVGTTYYVVVDGYLGAAGDYELSITCAVEPEVCAGGVDEDGDGLTDCADIDDCASDPACAVEPEVCAGGVDEDGDGLTDCADIDDCASDPACAAIPEECTGGGDEDGDGLTDCADIDDCAASPVCQDRTNWDFEDWATSDPPPHFTKSAASSFSIAQAIDIVQSGASAARVSWQTTDNRDLLAADRPAVVAGTTYTFHAWMYDSDPAGRSRLALRYYDASDAPTIAAQYATNYTTDAAAWREYTFAYAAPANSAKIQVFLRFYDEGSPFVSATEYTDDWAVTAPLGWSVGDGLLDTAALLVAGTPGSTMTLRAAINNAGVLYAATDWAASGTSDHVLYVWVGGASDTSPVPAPWAKAGTVAGPAAGADLFALVQEESSGFCHWLQWSPSATTWAEVATSCDAYAGGPQLEGSLDLVAILAAVANPTDVARALAFAVAPYASGDGGALLSAHQIPAAVEPDGNVSAAETQAYPRAWLLAGRVWP